MRLGFYFKSRPLSFNDWEDGYNDSEDDVENLIFPNFLTERNFEKLLIHDKINLIKSIIFNSKIEKGLKEIFLYEENKPFEEEKEKYKDIWQGLLDRRGKLDNLDLNSNPAYDDDYTLGARIWDGYLKLMDELLKLETKANELKILANKKREKTSPKFYKNFNEIFVSKDWPKYVNALAKTYPPLIDQNNKYIGKERGDKGAVASWFWELKDLHIIIGSISRPNLAYIINNEIEGFNIYKDGRTFSNLSDDYIEIYQKQLKKLVGL